MGLYDEYIPEPSLRCSHCGAPLGGWQGKSGPCGLFIWKQGTCTPIGQAVDDDDEWKLPEERLLEFGLPERFEIYTACDVCGRWADATGMCEGRQWKHTVLGRHTESAPIPAWPIGDGSRQCSACTEPFDADIEATLAECPSCRALTELRADR
jgi:hypothetical protein